MSVVKTLAPVLVLCLMAGVAGSGCNTIRGAGKDIQRGGEAVEDAAESKRRDVEATPADGDLLAVSANWGADPMAPGLLVAHCGKSGTFAEAVGPGCPVADVLVDGRAAYAVRRPTFYRPAGGHTISAPLTEHPIQ